MNEYHVANHLKFEAQVTQAALGVIELVIDVIHFSILFCLMNKLFMMATSGRGTLYSNVDSFFEIKY